MSPHITVCGLGPAGPELITRETWDSLNSGEPVWLRTRRHPAAEALPPSAVAGTFDDHYEIADTFSEVYSAICERLVELACSEGRIVYAVPGSPRVLERSVENLLAAVEPLEVDVTVLPAMSFLDLAWVRLGIDPLESSVRLIDGHRFAASAAGESGPLLVAHCHNQRVLSDIKLAVETPPLERVTVIQRLGLEDESVFELDWAELDREIEADHLTSLYIPELSAPVASELVRFDELVHKLRAECPWDREQTHSSLAPYAREEADEVVEAIAALSTAATETMADAEDHLAEELGDLMLQVFLHSTIAEERGSFNLADVATAIHDKMVRRHPQLFGGEAKTWEELKAQERSRTNE